jgi:hypothetical protein
MNNNQHYVTQSFVKKRFGKNGFVWRYDLINKSWKPNASPQFIFSYDGYTQFLVVGEPLDDSLEIEFQKVEGKLDSIYPIWDKAAENEAMFVCNDTFKDHCFYCAFLWSLSPFAKAKAPANLVMEIDFFLTHGHLAYLKELNLSEQEIQWMQKLHSEGQKFILNGENYLQYVFRQQFIRHCKKTVAMFRYNTEWTVYNSPIELPISDIPIIDYSESRDVTAYVMPVSNNRVLVGRLHHTCPYLTYPILYGGTLPADIAQNVQDLICLSALKTIVCTHKIDVEQCRNRAKSQNVRFAKVADSSLATILNAGQIPFDRSKPFRFIPVTKEKYNDYIAQYVTA